MPSPLKTHHLPWPYWLLLAYWEPFSAILGSLITHFLPHKYYTSAAQLPPAIASATVIPPATQIILSQLATMYAGFGLTEIVITRLCTDIRVWRAYVAVQVVSDVLYLGSLWPAGGRAYWQVGEWGVVGWGNYGILYVQMALRVGFLMGWGVRRVDGGEEGEGEGKGKGE